MTDNDSPKHSSSVGSQSTVVTTPDADITNDDVWVSDREDRNEHDRDNVVGNLLSDVPTVRRQHMTDGYREGLSVGKAKVMQKGFDAGYPVGVLAALRVGNILGCLEGVLAAKDVSDEVKKPVRMMWEQARQDLDVATILKGTNDEEIMQLNGIPQHTETILIKWETQLFGSSG